MYPHCSYSPLYSSRWGREKRRPLTQSLESVPISAMDTSSYSTRTLTFRYRFWRFWYQYFLRLGPKFSIMLYCITALPWLPDSILAFLGHIFTVVPWNCPPAEYIASNRIHSSWNSKVTPLILLFMSMVIRYFLGAPGDLESWFNGRVFLAASNQEFMLQPQWGKTHFSPTYFLGF